MEFRVNPIFFWHGLGYFAVLQKNKLNKINHLRDIFYLNFGGLGAQVSRSPLLQLQRWRGGRVAECT